MRKSLDVFLSGSRVGLALTFAGSRRLAAVDESSFEQLAARAGADVGRTLAVLRESLDQIAVAWREAAIADRMPPDHAAALLRYWSASALLRRYGSIGSRGITQARN